MCSSVSECVNRSVTGVCVGVSQWECVNRSGEVGRNISLRNLSKLGEPGLGLRKVVGQYINN